MEQIITEKLTPTKIGATKVQPYTNKKTGQPDSFNKVGFQTREQGDRWYNLAFRGDVPIREGQTYTFDVKSREYNGKTYYDVAFPSEKSELTKTLLRHEEQIQELWKVVRSMEIKKNTVYQDTEIPIVQEEPIEFDETGAAIRRELDTRQYPEADLPF